MNEFKIYIHHNGAKELIGTFTAKNEAVDFAIPDTQFIGEPHDNYWIDILSDEYSVTTNCEYDYEIIGE